MCLKIKSQSRKQIASKDITVYKHLIPYNITKGIYTTSYQSSIVEIGKTYHSDLVRITSTEVSIGLHSFQSEEVACKRATYWDETLVECIIPKGSSYYIGDFEGLGVSYASDTLTYIKILKS